MGKEIIQYNLIGSGVGEMFKMLSGRGDVLVSAIGHLQNLEITSSMLLLVLL